MPHLKRLAFLLIFFISIHAGSQDSIVKLTRDFIASDSIHFGVFKIYQIESNGDGGSWFIKAIPWFISLITIYLSLRAVKRDKIYRNVSFTTEVNKMMVNDPEVWAIYDENRPKYESSLSIAKGTVLSIVGKEKFAVTKGTKLTIEGEGKMVVIGEIELLLADEKVKRFTGENAFTTLNGKKFNIAEDSNIEFTSLDPADVINVTLHFALDSSVKFQSAVDKSFDDKLRAVCYYNLNNFDIIVKNQNRFSYYYDEWENFIIYMLVESSKFREIVDTEINRFLYEERFKEILRNLKATAALLKATPADFEKILRKKSNISRFINHSVSRWVYKNWHFVSLGLIGIAAILFFGFHIGRGLFM